MKILLSFFFENAYKKLTTLYRRSNCMDVFFNFVSTILFMRFHKTSLQISL